MPDTRMASWQHDDCQGDRLIIGCYADIGVGPAVVFDGGGFTDAAALRAFIADLTAAVEWLHVDELNPPALTTDELIALNDKANADALERLVDPKNQTQEPT